MDNEPWWSRYLVDVPVGVSNDWTIERFTIAPDDVSMALYNLRLIRDGHAERQVHPGTYTRLSRRSIVVMTDTPAEINDHMPMFLRLERPETRRVLIHGLGIGMVLQHALRQPHIEHIDVVELSQDVIDMVGPHYMKMATHNRDIRVQDADYEERLVTPGPTLNIIHGDALTHKFPHGTTWDVAWHDIWAEINTDNLPEMNLLNRRYGHACTWQGCWSKTETERHRRREVVNAW